MDERMQKRYKKAIFVFRRDLRLEDNTGLIHALQDAEKVLCCFVFDKRQVGDHPYKSSFGLQFMVHSLNELADELKEKGGHLNFLYGVADEEIAKLIKKEKIEAVYVNKDYTPFSKERDTKIKDACEKANVDFHTHADALLHEPHEVHKDDGLPYTVFTPFFRKASLIPVRSPQKNSFNNYMKSSCSMDEGVKILKKILPKEDESALLNGGRKEGLSLLRASKKLDDYKTVRDIPAKKGTTHLSAHHKFGTISVRETHAYVKKHLGETHGLITEIYWRDFFTHIAFHFPHVFKGAFRKQYNDLSWSKNKSDFEAWCEGKTGFPIVDAGMRELNATGYMHNRVRMIVASFLVKDLHINWQWGEKYFATKLLDYDPCVNNGNWQWAASTGCDAQPYFRIFNPWRQQDRFDPDCEYIKQWVPELQDLDAKAIQKLEKQRPLLQIDYPKPMVNHKEAAEFAKQMFKNIS